MLVSPALVFLIGFVAVVTAITGLYAAQRLAWRVTRFFDRRRTRIHHPKF